MYPLLLGALLNTTLIEQRLNITGDQSVIQLTDAELDRLEPLVAEDRKLWQHVLAHHEQTRLNFLARLGNRPATTLER